MRQVRVFVSSPGDAHFERMRVERVVERLNGEFTGVAKLTAIKWEDKFYKAHATFQTQIPEASACDIVIAIFRARLGTELPGDFPRMPNGEPYPSGTAYEVLTAIQSRQSHELPDVFVFRFPDPPSVKLDDPAAAETKNQWDRVKAFFDTWFKTPEGSFKAAFHSFNSTDRFEEQVDELLRTWLEEKILHGRSVVWPIEVKGSPFRGLAAFGTKHAPVFFGRSREVGKAVDLLKDAGERGCPFMLMVGPSGAGKSSLTRAGLVPRFTAPGVVPAIDAWRVAVMRPGEAGGKPILSLATRLFDGEQQLPEDERGRAPALPELTRTDFKTPVDLAALLSHADTTSPRPLLAALAEVSEDLRRAEGFDRPGRVDLLIIVDQLDELFATDVSEAERARFASLLAELARSGRVWIVATLRADLYERFLSEPTLKTLKDSGAGLDLAPPGPAELTEIVRAPAAAANLVYETDAKTGERLDDRLLKDADRADMLPLLQFTLNRLFEARYAGAGETRLTFGAYAALGGIEGAIDKEGERALAPLSDAEKARLPRLLRQLAVPAKETGGVASRSALAIRPVPLAEAASDALSRRLVEALVGARILLASGDGGLATVRLAHQRVLESWARAREIVATNADFYRIRADVEEQQRRWLAARRSRDLLVGAGLPLAEAETLRTRYADELPAELIGFIAQSGRRARLRQRLTGAAALLFAVLAVLAGWQWREAERNRHEAVEQRREAVEQRRQAVASQELAETQKKRAEDILESATTTANGLVLELAQKFKRNLGISQSLIREILERAQGLLDALSKGGEPTAKMLHTKSIALHELAQSFYYAGDEVRARETAEKALQLFEQLTTLEPNNVEYRHSLSTGYEMLAAAQRSQGKRTEAIANVRKSLEIREGVSAANPKNTGWRRDLSLAHNNLAKFLLEVNNRSEALVSIKKAMEITQDLVRAQPGVDEWKSDLAYSHMTLADVLSQDGKRPEAVENYQKAFELYDKLAKDHPRRADWQTSLASSRTKLGDMQSADRKWADALANYQKAFAIRENLALVEPGNDGRQGDMAFAHTKLGDALSGDKKHVEALAEYHKARVIRETLASSERGNIGRQTDLAFAYGKVADSLLADRKRVEAVTFYRKSLTIREQLVIDEPGTDSRLNDVAYTHGKIADALSADGKRGEALAMYQKSVAIREELATKNPDIAGHQTNLAFSYTILGNVLRSDGKRGEALANYRKALAVREKLVEKDPRNPAHLGDVAFTHGKIAEVLIDESKQGEAVAAYDKALVIREDLATIDAANVSRHKTVATLCQTIGGLLIATGKEADASQYYRKAVSVHERLSAEAEQADVKAEGKAGKATASALGNLAWFTLLARDFARTITTSDRALSLSPDLLWVETNRAHALLLQGNVTEAKKVYTAHYGTKLPTNNDKLWEQIIREDFAELRKAGMRDPVMDEIQNALPPPPAR